MKHCGDHATLFPQPNVTRARDGFGMVSHLQFAEDVGDMVADGLAAEGLSLGDLGVATSLSDEPKISRSRSVSSGNRSIGPRGLIPGK